jgi:hypothetical protein
MMDMAMMTELALQRRARRFAVALGLTVAAATAQAQDLPPAHGQGQVPAADASGPGAQDPNAPAPPANGRHRRPHAHAEVHPYLEVAQVLSADLGSGGDTLTYTSVAAGVDGNIETRRVSAAMSVRYERDIDWQHHVNDRDNISGVAAINAHVVPGVLDFSAGALATRTGGDGQVLGVTNRSENIDVYSVFLGPTLATHAGPLAVNASYRFGYVAVDDHRTGGTLNDDFDHATAHSATASVGMSPGALPFGWTVGGGYARENSGGRFRQRFEGEYVRGDVVVPVGPTLAVTAGIGYEKIQSSQRDFVRDVNGFPVIGPNGPTPDPTAPRLLTYDLDGLMYDGGLIWRPSPRTEVQVRAGHRYGGTTVVGSIDHRIDANSGVHAEVFDTVETFGRSLTNDLGTLSANAAGLNVARDPLTGSLGGCVFGTAGANGVCLDRSLSSISGDTFRMRGASLVFSGERGLWTYGVGAGYAHRRYFRPAVPGFAGFATKDDAASVYGSLGRRLSRDSEVDLSVYASWYGNDEAGQSDVTGLGATVSYSRNLLLERLRMIAALGIYHTDSGATDSTVAQALAGLRYTF